MRRKDYKRGESSLQRGRPAERWLYTRISPLKVKSPWGCWAVRSPSSAQFAEVFLEPGAGLWSQIPAGQDLGADSWVMLNCRAGF